ncbi:hypothetical protein [Streptomyces sp. NPDC059092]|uniref:hypothetical protein n=1 Tax=Streptomyces sp. NPDC059092 TaxID=3346725 RepID=UPI0036A67396
MAGKTRRLAGESGGSGTRPTGGLNVAPQRPLGMRKLTIPTYALVVGPGMEMSGKNSAIAEFTRASARTIENGVLVRNYASKR